MHSFIRKIRNQAKKNPKHIVFPEGAEERVLHATEIITKDKIAKITLLGNPKTIKDKAKKLKLKIDWKKVHIENYKTSKLKESFAKELVKLRKSHKLTLPQARELLKDMNYFGTMMVQMDLADGMVTGTTNSTADSIRPALQIIKTEEKFHKVSGVFFMVLEKRLLL
ncbi:MAG: phosphate acetyltransferase, partial [Nitrospirae bacterium]|nr:phosphate acetyltransferase [Nitrospirota bacterium]